MVFSGDFEKILLDHAARIGSLAKAENVPPNQLEQIIASLENSQDRENSVLICAAFAKRQANRLERGNKTALAIVEAMKEILAGKGGKEEARKLLGLAKWIKESLEDQRVPYQGVKNFEEYMNLLLSKR